MRLLLLSVSVGVVLALVACGGGGGLDSPTVGPRLRVIDLATGEWFPITRTLNSSDTALGRTKMVFVEVPAGNLVPGQNQASLGAQPDETPGALVAVPTFWLGLHEVTQAQWVALSQTGDRPWLRLTPIGSTASRIEHDLLPATGISFDALTDVVTDWNGLFVAQLSVPTEAQWEYACRAGSSGTLFHWGDSLDPNVANSYSVLGGAVPSLVVNRAPNAFGLYDMHGNVREWTAAETLRGGGWSDPVLRARCANRVDSLDPSTQHALSGARLIVTIP